MADTDDADNSDETTTLAEALDAAAEMAATESDEFDGDVPEHAPSLVVSRAENLLETARNIEMMEASENVEDVPDEAKVEPIEHDVVDILLALGTLQHEKDGLDIPTAFRERMSLVEDYQAFEEAIADADSREEAMDAVDEHMTDALEDALGEDGMVQPPRVDVGENVDRENYDPDERNRDVA